MTTDVLELVYEYRLLLAMQQELAITLDEGDRARLHSLWSMLEGKASERNGHRVMVRFPFPTRVRFTWQAGIGGGEIVNLSGGGVAVKATHSVDPNTPVILRVDALEGGAEFIFPCRVVWSRTGKETTMGLAFDGAPMVARAPMLHAA